MPYAGTPEEIREKQRLACARWAAEHREHERAYREKNREHKREYMAKWRAEHREHEREYGAKWRSTHHFMESIKKKLKRRMGGVPPLPGPRAVNPEGRVTAQLLERLRKAI